MKSTGYCLIYDNHDLLKKFEMDEYNLAFQGIKFKAVIRGEEN